MGKDKIKVVARDGIEPPTQGFSVALNNTLLLLNVY